MPYAPSFSWDDEKQNQKKNAGFNVSGQSTNFATNLPGQDNEKSKSGSGQYANIQNYLNANQDQSKAMGQQIASNVEQKGQQAQQDIQGLSNQAQKVEAFDPNSITSKAGSGLTDLEKSQYQNIKQTGGYSGPQDVTNAQGYSQAMKSSSEASDLAKSAASESGQQALLKQTYNNPKYTAGQNKLDQALLMGNQEARNNLSSLSSKYSDLSNLFNTESQKVGESINQAKTQALANQNALLANEQKALSDFKASLQPRVDELNLKAPGLRNTLLEDVKDNMLTSETRSALGLNLGDRLFNRDIGDYVTLNQNAANFNNVATQAEREKYKDLLDLFGAENTLGISDQVENFSPYSIDKQRLSSDIASDKKAFNDWAAQQNIYVDNKGARYVPSANGDSIILSDYLNSGMNNFNWSKNVRGENTSLLSPQQVNDYIRNLITPDLINRGYYNQILHQGGFAPIVDGGDKISGVYF